MKKYYLVKFTRNDDVELEIHESIEFATNSAMMGAYLSTGVTAQVIAVEETANGSQQIIFQSPSTIPAQ